MVASQPVSAADGADDAARRKRLGAWYTPPTLVDHVVAESIRDWPRHPVGNRSDVVVLDPACGDGRFLGAVRTALGERTKLIGCDVDPHAVRAARAALGSGAQLLQADALGHDWTGTSIDLVITNPPFLNQLATATRRVGRSRFGGGPYVDTAAEFLALAMSLAHPDAGRVAMVVPQSLFAARDAAPIRAAVTALGALRHVWWSTTSMFDAQVRTAALVFECGAAQGEITRSAGPRFEPRAPLTATRLGASWGALLLDEVDHLDDTAPIDTPCIGDIATVSADFRDQYYGLVGAVSDDGDGPPLVTCGLIDPGRCHWGERPVRFAKQSFTAPRVDLAALSPALQRWAAGRLVPKVLVANQTRHIEAVVDRDGAWLPGVPVISVVPHRLDDLDRVAAALGSPAATTWVQRQAAGTGLGAGTVRLSPRLVASIPLLP